RLSLCVRFAQPNPRHLRIRENAERHEPVASTFISAVQIVANNPEIVSRDMSELRATGAFSHSPNTWRRGLKAFIHSDIATLIHFYASFLQPYSVSVRNSSDSDEKVGPLQGTLACQITHAQRNPLT